MKNETIETDLPTAASKSALPDRRELAIAAFERTRMPMVMTDAQHPDQPIVLANQAFLNLTGYTADEVIGQNCRLLQGESTSSVAIAEIRSGIRQGKEVEVELLNYRKSGEGFWNQLHLSPIHDEAGNLQYYFGSQVDVTKYRNVQSLEASEHRLLMEVDHRAKNVLALVDSVVRLSTSNDAQRYASSVQHRVQSLARAHSLLADHHWTPVTLRELLLAQLENASSSQVRLTGPDVPVAPIAVQPLSLVLHELVRNSVEHGALSVRDGLIDLNWTRLFDRDGFKLSCGELGGPPARRPEQRGFGMVIADALIQRQLLGSIDRQWLDTGLITTIELPNA